MSKLLNLSVRQHFILWLVSLFLTLGCQIQLVSAYDQIVDQTVSDLHTQVVAFTTTAIELSGKPEGSYEANKARYGEFKASTATLRLRAADDPKNGITVKMIDELAENLERLRKAHEIGGEAGLKPAMGNPALAALETNFKTIIEFELAKKRDGLNSK